MDISGDKDTKSALITLCQNLHFYCCCPFEFASTNAVFAFQILKKATVSSQRKHVTANSG